MTERQLEDSIIELAHLFGWRVAHFRTVRTQRKDGTVFYQTPVKADGAGFPDLVLAKDGVVHHWELKGYNARGVLGKATVEQEEWLEATGGRLITPAEWLNGEIERILSDGRIVS